MQLVSNDSAVFSESYNTGLSLGLLALALIYAFGRFHGSEAKESRFDPPAACLLPCLIGVVGLFKISTGLILSALWAYLMIRKSRRQFGWALVSLAILGLVNAGVMRYCALRAPVHFSPFYLVRTELGLTWIPSYRKVNTPEG
jgi:hypothetical protein